MQENKYFELLGIDVLVDDTLHPWLLEVNPDPDLSAKSNFPLAKVVKSNLLHDLLHLVGMLPADKFALECACIEDPDCVSPKTNFASSIAGSDGKNSIDRPLHYEELREGEGNNHCMFLKLLERCRFKVKEDFFRYIPQFVESELEMNRLKNITRIINDKKSKVGREFYPVQTCLFELV